MNDIRLISIDIKPSYGPRVHLICNGKEVDLWWSSIFDLDTNKCILGIDSVNFCNREFTETMKECVDFGRKCLSDEREKHKQSLEAVKSSIESEKDWF